MMWYATDGNLNIFNGIRCEVITFIARLYTSRYDFNWLGSWWRILEIHNTTFIYEAIITLMAADSFLSRMSLISYLVMSEVLNI